MRRAIVFLLLLAIGVGLLRFATGDEAAALTTSTTERQAEAPTPAPAGVNVQQGRIGASVAQTGRLELPRWREIPAAGGRTRREEVFVLLAEDSRPIGEGLQQLDRVNVRYFDQGKPAGDIAARQAFVELQRDANGQPSLSEGKMIDTRDTVLTTLPGSRLAGMRLELGDARFAVGELEVVVTTAADQPVCVTLDGDRQGTLRGAGVQARLPREANSGLRRADVEILHEPVLLMAGLTARSKGRLRYVEDTLTGEGQITLDEEVRLDLTKDSLTLPGFSVAPGEHGTPPEHAIARGDQFTSWFTRTKHELGDGREKQQMAWQRLLLTGAPATVEASGGRISSPRLSVLPGLTGQPFLVTAHGGESTLVVRDLGPDATADTRVVASSRRRTHMVMPGEYVGSIYRAYGFPGWALRALDEAQLVVSEGPTKVDSGRRSCDAEKGVWVWRRDREQAGVVLGHGTVHYRQRAKKTGEPDLVATGNDGFRLRSSRELEELQLGHPGSPARPGHRYELRLGDARVSGSGSCLLAKSAGRTRMLLQAPAGDIVALLPNDGITFAGVARLDATLRDEAVEELIAAGAPVRATIVRGDETIVATAPLMQQIGPGSLRLLPPGGGISASLWADLPATKRQPTVERRGADDEQVEVRGPQIDLHHAGARDVIVDAIAVDDERPHVYARLPQPEGREATTIACEAERLRLLPFVMTKEMQRAHLAGHTGAWQQAVFHALGRPWLIVDVIVDFQLDDALHGHCEGRGRQLLVSQGAAAAIFVGDPATGEPAVVTRRRDQREVTTEGARVRLFRDDDLRLHALASFADHSTLVPPTVTLHEPGRDGLLSHMQAHCRGNIEVRPDAVVFGGPVVARTLHADGSEDPEGMLIDARELQLVRHVPTGEIVEVLGKDVRLDWSRVRARGAAVEIDLRRSLCVVRDPNEARIELPDRRAFLSPHLEINYETMAIRSYRGRSHQLAADGAVAR